jgi:hypothetical protein
MSWLYSQALVEEYLVDTSLDGEQSVQLSGNPTQLAYLSPDKMTEYSRLSRFGMMFKPLTVDRGAVVLMSYLAAFPVKPIHQRLEAAIQRTTFGRRCGESWQMSLLGTFLPKTSAELRLTKRPMTLSRWVTKPKHLPYPRRTWVLTTFGHDTGYLHTPTTIANFCAPSMQKHPSCREWVKTFGKVTPLNYEWLMGWPLGWTGLRPLEMGRCHYAQQKHGGF